LSAGSGRPRLPARGRHREPAGLRRDQQPAGEDERAGEDLSAYAGLARRQPWLGLALLLFLLSLAGIPFVAGFWAKLYVFLAAARAGLWALVALGALLSVVALFAYLRVAREAYLGAPAREGRVAVAAPLAAAIWAG
jgi:NADH-quinone oxidoreductase subunit N